jgi:hypothetical protein
MKTSLKDTKRKLVEQMLEFLWRQWSAIGLAGHAEHEDNRVIDPEALLLVSSEFARHDARLFDEILDWLDSNGNLINLKRVFNIRKQYPLGNPIVMKAIARKLCKNSTFIKWKTLNDKSLHTATHGDAQQQLDGLIDLFPKLPFTMGALPTCDEDFRAVGIYRPRAELRGMSQPPSPHAPTNLIFKMRALFGCNSRAEIMAWLLTHRSGHPAQIARDTHYFSKSVQSTLNEMATSGLITANRSNREKHFRITPSDWSAFYGNHQTDNPPQWQPWAEIFTTIQLYDRTLNQQGLDSSSELFQAAMLKETMDAFPYTKNYLTTDSTSGTNYLHTLLNDFQTLLNELTPGS